MEGRRLPDGDFTSHRTSQNLVGGFGINTLAFVARPGKSSHCEREAHNRHLTRSRLIAAQGTAATTFRYSSSENARKVSVRTFPIAPLARATWATASSFGSSEIATASYCPVTR